MIDDERRGVVGWIRSVIGGVASLTMLGFLCITAWDADGSRALAICCAIVVSVSLGGVHSRRLVWQVSARSSALAFAVIGSALWLTSRDLAWAWLSAALPTVVLLAAGGRGLSTRAALAEFSPIGYRRSFLAAAIVQIAGGLVLGLFAIAGLGFAWEDRSTRDLEIALVLGSVAAAGMLGAYAVLRMRAWGVLLSGATCAVTLSFSLWAGLRPMAELASDPDGAIFAATAVVFSLFPLLVVLPVLASWIRPVRVPLPD